MRTALPLFSVLALVSCTNDSARPYYEARQDPELTVDGSAPSGARLGSESGNLGGSTVTFSGSGFGDDPTKIVVLIGNHNAEVLSVTDSAVTVRTPVGPITGGPVDVVIGTPFGYVTEKAAYTYNVTPPGLTEDLYTGETSYILVENLWTSCYGGMYENPNVGGCEDIAYIGDTGLNGVSEWYRFPYPRIQTTRFGWFTGADYHPGSWQVTGIYDLVFPTFVDDLRREVGSSFKITNPLNLGDTVCIDPELDPADNEVDCDDDGAVQYDAGTLEFCEGLDPETGGNFEYVADWPVKRDFFEGLDDDNDASPFVPVDVSIAFDESAGIDFDLGGSSRPAFDVRVPGSMYVMGESGFAGTDGWAVGGVDTCLDADDDGEARLDESGLRLSWTPIPTDADLGGPDVAAVGSYVHVSVSFLPLGWFGLTTGAPRASIVVPDDNEYDPETGLSYVSIPNSVMYQFPTPNFNYSSVSNLNHTGTLGTFESGAAYMLVEIYRVTDFAVPYSDGTNENKRLIFSYVTGDLSFMSDWKNPIQENKVCSDCADGDGDGWVDADDPDCNDDVGGTGAEIGFNPAFTCNDGLDNNDDGLADSDDPLCQQGWDGETTCTDGLDNDEDGWVDAGDSDCTGDPEAQEDGSDTASTCSNGLDDDGDGWADADDPGCTIGSDSEDDGFAGTPCNDGADNDGHGDIDALDPYCAEQGADAAGNEVPEFKSGCADGADSESSTADRDGYVDAFDPDCEYKPSSREYADHFEAGSHPVIPACYDGLDNDGDGSADGADPSCWRGDLGFVPDGFIADEAASWGTGCSDGADSDADGWIDGLDPDCKSGSADTQAEIGFGSTACNDGVDNNDDGKIDSESSYCKNGSGTFEGP